MDYIVIDGVRPYDGRYEFDLDGSPLTTREWGWIKRLAGYLPLTVDEGYADPELITVFGAIALHRAGRVEAREVPEVFERLSDAPFGSKITLDTEDDQAEEEGDESRPPPQSSTSNDDSSGPSSRRSSEISVIRPRVSGTPDSATSESAGERSAT